MNPREAIDADLKPLAAFIQRELAAWGYDAKATAKGIQQRQKVGWRYGLLEEDGTIVAALSVAPSTTDEGLAYEVRLWLVAFDYPDKIEALDAMALWGCKLLLSEGVRILTTIRDESRHLLAYGENLLGMKAKTVSPELVLQVGDTEVMVAEILKRRPSWRTSP